MKKIEEVFTLGRFRKVDPSSTWRTSCSSGGRYPWRVAPFRSKEQRWTAAMNLIAAFLEGVDPDGWVVSNEPGMHFDKKKVAKIIENFIKFN